MKTVKISVPKAFKYVDGNGVTKEFAPGVLDVPADVAEHWYVKAHSEPVDKEAAKKAAAEESARKTAAEKAAKEAAEKAEAERKAAEEEAARKAAEEAAKNGGKK